MNERARRAAELRTLLARLSHQRETLNAVTLRLQRAISRAINDEDPEAVAATALFLQHYYTAIEDALLRIAEVLDGSVPAGDDWHRALVEQMHLDIPEVRPPLIDDELLGHLDVLRRFRHRVRHAYDQEYEWRKMEEPVEAKNAASELLSDFFKRTDLVVREIIAALERSLNGG